MRREDKKRIAIFGMGGVAERIHFPVCSMLPEVEVVGACEINAERRQRMGKQFDIRAVYDDSVTLLEKMIRLHSSGNADLTSRIHSLFFFHNWLAKWS